MSWDAHAQTTTEIAASLVVTLGALGALARRIVRKLDKVDQVVAVAEPLQIVASLAPDIKLVVEDHRGVPDRPGVPGRPPMMATLAAVVENQRRHDEGQVEILRRIDGVDGRVAIVERELHPDGGSTLVDKVNVIKATVTKEGQQ